MPAFVWRGGFFSRALIIGLAVGVSLGAMAWIDSGMLLAGAIVFVLMTIFYGTWMTRRMSRYWPGAKDLTGDERVAVARATRHGERIGHARLAQPVIDFNQGMHSSAEKGRPFRWIVPLVLVVSLGTAVWDALFGSWGNTVASAIYLVALLLELLWWPKWRDQILANGDRAADIAAHVLDCNPHRGVE